MLWWKIEWCEDAYHVFVSLHLYLGFFSKIKTIFLKLQMGFPGVYIGEVACAVFVCVKNVYFFYKNILSNQNAPFSPEVK